MVANVQSSTRSTLGIAKETVRGTAVTPTDFIAVTLSKLKPVDDIASLFDDGIRGSNVKNYARIPGRAHSTYDLGGPVFADTFAYFVAGLLGEVVTVGASAPYTHTIALKNSVTAAADDQPTAFTLTDFYAAAVRAWPGQMVNEVSLKFSADGLLEFDAKCTGFVSATASVPTASYSVLLPVPVWQGTVTIGGSAVAYAVSGEITMKRTASPVWGTANTQNPYQIHLGPLEASAKFTFVMESDAELTRYLTDTQPAIVLNWAAGSGATATQIQATMTKGAYTAAAIERGKDHVEVAVSVDSQANVTDKGTNGYSPIKWVFQNAKPASTYQ